ncbi:DUF6779 domain-containing protein [Actinokineospora terrae]|uniref:DUF6779 domain-containing protein n=1 Tax=Actinokineospora terrae TaxID=155974 RepID=A0A1H9UA94_9PSEU|nr:DUF6779 domain-containing protein [Actinokineospora terrae]SES06074.1 hypothetical protein SAMN04487818_10779 [Actinokineospora terrae]
MTGRTDPTAQGSRGARALLLAALGLALASTAVLVLSDSLRWMRLGVVAALWAALAGAFLAARYRRQVADRADEAAERQRVYELELEREVAARREFELEVEATTRRKVEAETSDDLTALREELHHLRHSLEALLGGEVLVERFALHAEATRMRGIADNAIVARPANPVRHITAGGDPDTQLIGRVARNQWVRDEDPDRIDPDWTPSWESSRQSAPIPAQNRVKPLRREPAEAGQEFDPIRRDPAAPQRPATAPREAARSATNPPRRDPAPARTGAYAAMASQQFEPVRPGPESSQDLAPVRAGAQGRDATATRTAGPARPEQARNGAYAAETARNGAHGPEASQEFGPVRANGRTGSPARPDASQQFEPVRNGAHGPEASQEFGPVRAQGRDSVRAGGPARPDASQQFEPVRNGAHGTGAGQEFGSVRANGRDSVRAGGPARPDAADVGQQFESGRNGAHGPEASQEFGPVRANGRDGVRAGGPAPSQAGAHGPEASQVRPGQTRALGPARPESTRTGAVARNGHGPEVSQEFSPVRQDASPARAGAHGPEASQQFGPVQQQPRREVTAQVPVRNGADRAPEVRREGSAQAPVRQQPARPRQETGQEFRPAAREAQPTPGAVRDMPAPGSVQRPRSAERTEVAMTPAPDPAADPGGRRRAVTGTFPPVNAQHADQDPGGRRRRSEGAPAWHESIAAEEPQEDTGSHSSGKSVSELLAAHGTGGSPRRHRRRGED